MCMGNAVQRRAMQTEAKHDTTTAAQQPRRMSRGSCLLTSLPLSRVRLDWLSAGVCIVVTRLGTQTRA
jgi:hypothetical protein